MGWLLLSPAVQGIPSTPRAPVLQLISPISDTTPEFAFYLDHPQDGDDLQFERKAIGDDWSISTITNHTITSGEIAGTPIDLALSALDPGNYAYRAKHNHAGGSYSDYSPIETAVVDPSLRFNFQGQLSWAGAGGSVEKTATMSVGPAYSTRRVSVFGGLTDDGGGNTVAGITFNGIDADLSVSGSGFNLYYYATAIVAEGASVDFVLTYSGGAFNSGQASVYVMDDTTLNSPIPVAVHHPIASSATSTTLTVGTEDGGTAVIVGLVFGGTDAPPGITSSDDTYVIDYSNGSALFGAHVNGTEAHSPSSTTVAWTPARDNYFTIWSFR